MSVKLLDEADINEIEADAFNYVLTEEDVQWVRESSQMRLIATLRAEQEARRRAEAQRDRLASALREIAQGAHWTYQNEHTLRPSQLRDIALTALREIEGGSDV